ASSAYTTRNARKRSHSPEPFQATVTKGLETFMDKQNRLLEQLVALSKHQTDLLTLKADYLHSDSLDGQEVEEEETDDWVAPAITDVEPAESQEAEPIEDHFFDFAPDTKESESKIGIAEEAMLKQGSRCLRLGEASWQNIRYADVQKLFQATLVFTSLKVNSVLATVTPGWKTVALLDKMDACLGAIIHGILQQRKHFQNICSEFRHTSDSLLQYTCGRRAKIFQQRRSVFKPINKTLNELLHAIPPSNTHLFAEPQLGDLIKEQGGVHKFFPVRKYLTDVNKSKPQNRTVTIQERSQNYRRERGIRVIVYLDDFLLLHSDPDILVQQNQFVQKHLSQMGWCINYQKTSLVPSRAVEYLGLLWNTEQNIKQLPEQKIQKCAVLLKSVLVNQ
ncbi:putative transposon Ty3-I Gag-Pol polyprotein, partial [Operophtera brumata]